VTWLEDFLTSKWPGSFTTLAPPLNLASNPIQYQHAPLYEQLSPADRSILSCVSCLRQPHVKRGHHDISEPSNAESSGRGSSPEPRTPVGTQRISDSHPYQSYAPEPRQNTVSFTFNYHTWQCIIFTIFTFTIFIFSYSFSLSFWTQDLGVRQVLSSTDLFLSYRTDSTNFLDHLFFILLNGYMEWCVRLSRLLVGFRTHSLIKQWRFKLRHECMGNFIHCLLEI